MSRSINVYLLSTCASLSERKISKVSFFWLQGYHLKCTYYSYCVDNWEFDGHKHCKVPIPNDEYAVDAKIVATCKSANFKAVCNGPVGCQYNDDSECIATTVSKTCGNGNLQDMASKLCGSNDVAKCQELDKVFGASRGINENIPIQLSFEVFFWGGGWLYFRLIVDL